MDTRFVTLERAERTQDWNSVVSPTNPVWSIVRTKRERRATFVHGKATVTGRSQSKPRFFQNRYCSVGSNLFHTGSSSNYKNNPTE